MQWGIPFFIRTCYREQPLTEALTEYFFKEANNFIPLYANFTGSDNKKTRVSESILPSRDAKNNWNCQILYCKKTVRQVVNFSDLGSSKINPRLCFTVQFQPKSSYM